MARYWYDEFAMLDQNAAEWGLTVALPTVVRASHVLSDGRVLSYLKFGTDDPRIVFIHGGAQNAHTFDTVNLALGLPALCVDLPGHGHSDPSPYGLTAIASHARDVVEFLTTLCPEPIVLVGMSLGGLTSLLVTRDVPHLVRHLILVDITPGITEAKAKHIRDFVNGPATFNDFDELLALTKKFNPTRSESSLWRGILHNAVQRDDGSWVWRHQQHGPALLDEPPVEDLWDVLASLTSPVTLVRALGAGSVVDDADTEEFRTRRPDDDVVEVSDSGHSVQGDQPLVLAALCAARATR
jgi:pimeloyl-ACP methyl ester carboxylesterase